LSSTVTTTCISSVPDSINDQRNDPLIARQFVFSACRSLCQPPPPFEWGHACAVLCSRRGTHVCGWRMWAVVAPYRCRCAAMVRCVTTWCVCVCVTSVHDQRPRSDTNTHTHARTHARTRTLSLHSQLVMNYLVVEGYKDAAEMFENESGESPRTPLDAVASRMRVRQAMQQGRVTDAMEVRADTSLCWAPVAFPTDCAPSTDRALPCLACVDPLDRPAHGGSMWGEREELQVSGQDVLTYSPLCIPIPR
jgi:hypothetical protein